MRHKKHSGSNNHRRNNNGRGKYRSGGGGGGNDSQSLARQKKHALTQKEKYLAMARDAQVNGERVDAEYYYQHVEHYSRVLAEIAEKEPQPERREEANDNEAMEARDGNKIESDDSSDDDEDSAPAVEEKPKQTRGRRRAPSERQSKNEEIPLPASVIPEAEAVAN